MSDWIQHLKGLAALEDNVGKKVAFETSAEKIQQLERERMVKIPQTADEAKSMYLVALKWLQDNAPNELNQAKKQHNTEQQIKALEEFCEKFRMLSGSVLAENWQVSSYFEQLRKGGL